MWKKSERNTRLFSSSDNARLSSAASAMAAFIPLKRSIRRRVLVPLFCCPPKLLYHGGIKNKQNKQNKIDGFFIHLLFCVCLMYDDDTKSAANSIFPFELPNDDRYRCDCNE